MFTELADKLRSPVQGFTPAASIEDRSAWEALDPGLAQKLVKEGERFLGYDCPPLRATDFMEFSRTGNRVNYETKLFARRTALNTLVLAECAENQGRFLDDIVNLLFAICEESAWQLPAHNAYERDVPQFLLPDVTRPVIDLFAAETGAVLAMAEYLLKKPLADISPAIGAMISDNLNRRIFTPYLNEHFWWMGDGKSAMNNWTIWCTQNILIAAFAHNPGSASGSGFGSDSNDRLDESRRNAIFHKACQSIDYFLAEYGTDGCCDEGAQYYRHAGLCLFGCMEILNTITDGGFSRLYQNEKIKNIALYILNVHVDGIYYVNFSDCSPVAGRCNAREFLFGKRIGSAGLMCHAATDYKQSDDPLILREQNLYYRLLTVFTHEKMMAYDTSLPVFHPDLYYDSVGLFLARDEHLCLAVKAGDNDDSHNHNDTGSFTIYKDGKPLFIDVGVESYTKKTFSPERYSIWTMQSQYHNLPSFGGCGPKESAAFPYAYTYGIGSNLTPVNGNHTNLFALQMNGAKYKATNVEYSMDSDCCQISMDIADAYPDTGIRSYRRSAALEKGKQILIHDIYEGDQKPVILSLMTYEKPCWDAASSTLQIGENFGSCKIDGAKEIHSESIPVTDSRLRSAWAHEIYRTLVVFQKDELTLTIQ